MLRCCLHTKLDDDLAPNTVFASRIFVKSEPRDLFPGFAHLLPRWCCHRYCSSIAAPAAPTN